MAEALPSGRHWRRGQGRASQALTVMPHAVASHPSHLITPSPPCGSLLHAERAHRDIRAGS
eukprot:5091489-Prymnesium_polylepis.1